MYMDLTIITIILILNLLAIIYLIYKTDKASNSNSNNSKDEILGLLSSNLQTTKDDLLQKINNLNQAQNTTLLENKSELSLKFKDLISFLEQSNMSSKSDQKEHFGFMGERNNQNLLSLQNTIQTSLSTAILDLAKINNENFEILRKTNEQKLDTINQDVQKRLDISFQQHLKSFEEVSKNIGQIQNVAKQMIDSTSSVDKLNNLFARTSSKAFGDFGEKYLHSMLSQNLHSNSYQTQVTVIGSSDKIDFVVNIQGKKIGIDSKFPATKFQDYLEAEQSDKATKLKEFLKSVMLMANDISRKYDKNGFVDYLLMYLPSEGMYTEVANNVDVIEYLAGIKITPVSPITIFPIICNIKVVQHRENINQNAEAIIKALTGIKRNILTFQDEFKKLGDKLRLAQANYSTAENSLMGVTGQISQLEYIEEKKLGVEII
jgi:DNA recombination protein RmuC